MAPKRLPFDCAFERVHQRSRAAICEVIPGPEGTCLAPVVSPMLGNLNIAQASHMTAKLPAFLSRGVRDAHGAIGPCTTGGVGAVVVVAFAGSTTVVVVGAG